MPRYDYHCPGCDLTFEVEHGMREKVEPLCPRCGEPAQRVFSAAGMVLKGSGFYNTDNREKPEPACSDATPACEGCPHAATE